MRCLVVGGVSEEKVNASIVSIYKDMEEMKTELQKNISKSESRITALENSIDKLDTRVTALEQKIEELSARISAL